MPGQRVQRTIDPRLCRRCQAIEPAITVRSEPLCTACFGRYVHSKVIKRMESFRVRHAEPGQPRRLLLPIGFDACSLAVLYILSQHLKGQDEKTGRTGYRLCLVHVSNAQDAPSSDGQDGQDDHNPSLDQLKSYFPEHEYHHLSLHDVLAIDGVSDLLELDASATAKDAGERQPAILFQETLRRLPSATARADVQTLLRRKLLVHFSKTHACEAILWPSSTTALAEQTLAETAKGRGLSLPWIVSDGQSPYGVPFFHPLQDLLNKEIEAFVATITPTVEHLLVRDSRVKPAASTKHTTIDDLMTQYFAGVELEYPSIVGNVVKTTGKLHAPSLREVEMQCELCEMPLIDGHAPERSRLCYPCIRTLPPVSLR